MILIKEIYSQLGIDESLPPHYFELENLGEMFIPLEKNDTKNDCAKVLHLLPQQQNLSPSKTQQIIRGGENIPHPYESTRLLLSHKDENSGGRADGGTRVRGTRVGGTRVRFHILSASPDDETATALRLLLFFVEEMEVIGV